MHLLMTSDKRLFPSSRCPRPAPLVRARDPGPCPQPASLAWGLSEAGPTAHALPRPRENAGLPVSPGASPSLLALTRHANGLQHRPAGARGLTAEGQPGRVKPRARASAAVGRRGSWISASRGGRRRLRAGHGVRMSAAPRGALLPPAGAGRCIWGPHRCRRDVAAPPVARKRSVPTQSLRFHGGCGTAWGARAKQAGFKD